MPPLRRIAILAFDDVQSLDVTGPVEVFSLAVRLAGARYETSLVAAGTGPVRTSSGLTLVPDRALADFSGPLDTLVVAGGWGVRDAARDPETVAWVRAAAARSRRVASVCTGAFLLARAGLLDGRRATTHWSSCARLAREHPAVEVVTDAIYVRDGNVYTSAGVSTGIDLALALVEEDLGRRVALDIARSLVVYIRRSGAQPQLSAGLAAASAGSAALGPLLEWMAEHLEGDLSVLQLAQRAFLSPRHFARVFKREVGVAPGAYVESLRLERAQALLATTDLSVEEVARQCGFGTVETMRRSFGRRLGATPGAYREPGALGAPAPGGPAVVPLRRSAA